MNSRIILAVLTIAVLSSCTTAYKAQTPDDVYYSPAKPQEEYVRVEKDRQNDYYSTDEGYTDDRYLRWKVRNRTRWSSFDNYSNDWYDYSYNNWSYWNRNNYYLNSYWSWNRYYNPYCGRTVVIVNPKYNPTAYNQVRNYKAGTYKNTYGNGNTFSNPKSSPGTYRPSGSYNNSNSNSLGSSIKKVFSNSGNSNSNSSSDSRPNRTYTPSSSNSSSNSSSSGSSSSGSSGGGGGVSRPSRGG